MRKLMNRTLLSQCVLVALASFSSCVSAASSTPCVGDDTSQTCGLRAAESVGDISVYQQDNGVANAVMADPTSGSIFMNGHFNTGETQSLTVNGTDMTGSYIQVFKEAMAGRQISPSPTARKWI